MPTISSGNLGASRSLDAKIPQSGASTPVTNPRQIIAAITRTVTADDSLTISDLFNEVLVDSAGNVNITVPPGIAQLDDEIYITKINTGGSAVVTFVAGGSGGTLQVITPSSGSLTDAGLDTPMMLKYRGSNAWDLFNGTPISIESADVISALGYTPSKRILLFRNNITSSSVVVVTTETLVESILIPGGTFQANDIVNVVVRTNKTGTAGTTSGRIRFHTASAVAGTIVAISTGGTTNLYMDFARNIVFKNSVSSQAVYVVSSSAQSDLAAVGAARSSLSINFAIDQYAIVTLQNSSAADTSAVDSWYIEIIRQ